MSNRLAFCCVCGLLVTLGPAARADYSFTNIADTARFNAYFRAFGDASINSSGVVSFGAFPNSTGVSGAYTGTGGAFTTVVQSGVNGYGNFTGDATIGDGGAVAFLGTKNVVPSVFVSNGGVISTVADASNTAFGGFTRFQGDDARVNGSGNVVFNADRASVSGIYVGNGSAPATTIVDTGTGTNGGFSSFIGNPDIANNGDAAFLGNSNSLGSGLFLAHNGTVTRLFNTNPLNLSQNVSLNNQGTVAFAFGDQGILTANTSGFSVYADTSASSPFSTLAAPTINDSGQVVFLATLKSTGQLGIFTGNDPIASKVIQVGDALDGSTVTNLSLLRGAFNNNGQVAFKVVLADGRGGIFRADPVPEPGSIALMGLGLVVAWPAARRLRGRPTR